MADVIFIDPVNAIHGKLKKTSDGYFWQSRVTGKRFYRQREENYQQNQSPRQKWNSQAFKYAHQQLRLLMSTPEFIARLRSDYEAANHRAPNGKTYTTLRAWKFNSLLHAYKLAHPFEA